MAKVLVIDDEAAMRRTMRRMLEESGHAVIEAANGKEGLAQVESGTPDLIICDLIMPEQEGIETIAKIIEQKPFMPILAISGGGRTHRTDFLKIAERMGARGVLSKPFDATTFMAAVNRALG